MLPDPVRASLERTLDAPVRRAVPVGGGMISCAARVHVGAERVFVKWNAAAPPGIFESEADGLHRLRRAGALRVPAVLVVGDPSPVPHIALEWIESSHPQDAQAFAWRFGESLAALHALPGPGRFGLDRDNFLGALPQPNPWHRSWVAFYREARLLPLVARARRQGLLPAARELRLRRVVERLETTLEGFEPAPSLLHGDLWSGNFLPAGQEPVVIDPAVYWGAREMEIAFIELFGGFPDGFLDAYRAALPLDPGYSRRRPVHQLYPLLVHLCHFGEAYGPDVDRACAVAAG